MITKSTMARNPAKPRRRTAWKCALGTWKNKHRMIDLAREALAHCRRVAAGDSEDDLAPLLAFASGYGLRLEWILTGNLRGTTPSLHSRRA